MKTMNNKIFWIFTLTVLCIAACVDEDKKPFTDFKKGAIPLFTKNTDDSGFVNYSDLNASNLSFTVDKEGLAKVTSIDVTITYNNIETGKSETAVLTSVTAFPSTVKIGKTELINAFPTSVLTEDSISVGDSFTIAGNVKLEDGTYLNGGYSPSIFSKKPVSLNYSVSCVSAIPAGSYKAVSTASSTDGCPPQPNLTDFPYDVVLTANGSGSYTVSDIFAGVYMNWYGDCYGYTTETAEGFNDVCGQLSISFIDGFGAGVTGSGTYDPSTGKITYTWTNDFADTGTVVLTPQ